MAQKKKSAKKRVVKSTKKPLVKTLDDLNLLKFAKSAHRATDEGQDVLLKYFGKLESVRDKYKAGLVSEADEASEKVISTVLKKAHPELAFLGEESSILDRSGFSKRSRWIVDPLDGTTNYVHGFHIFGISLALQLDGEIVLGIVDIPMLKQRFSAIRGKGAFINKKRIHVSKREKVTESLLATGFYAHDEAILNQQIDQVKNIAPFARGIRRSGSAAYDLCQVALGTFDAYWESHLQPWDTAAGALIVEEAGGAVTNYAGERFSPEHLGVLASNKLLHKECMRLIFGK